MPETLKPLVSVIVPNFNHAPYLELRLRSIVAQEFRDFELILLDDASTDGSRELCCAFADEHPCILVLNETNSGSPFKQWRTGIDKAAGKYIWIAESDDVATPDFLKSIVQLMEQNPACGLAYCNSMRIDAGGRTLRKVTDTFSESGPLHWNESHLANGRNELQQFMLYENTVPNASAVVFRRSTYDAAGGVDATMTFSADWKLWASMMTISSVAYTAATLNYFRCHDRSVRASVKAWPALAEALNVMRHITSQLSLSASIKQRLDLRIWVLYLDAFTRKFPTLQEFRATAELARKLHAGLSFEIAWLLLGRMFNASVKRIAALIRTATDKS